MSRYDKFYWTALRTSNMSPKERQGLTLVNWNVQQQAHFEYSYHRRLTTVHSEDKKQQRRSESISPTLTITLTPCSISYTAGSREENTLVCIIHKSLHKAARNAKNWTKCSNQGRTEIPLQSSPNTSMLLFSFSVKLATTCAFFSLLMA
jgi:hypothetical protein